MIYHCYAGADPGSKVRGAISVTFVSKSLITASLLQERWSIHHNTAVTKQWTTNDLISWMLFSKL